MNRAGVTIAAVVALAVTACAPGPEFLCNVPPDVDVIVVVVDALRADHLGCYGSRADTSPAIDALAADGVLFEQAIAQSTYTGCSIASLFTGLEPHHHGLYWGSLRGRDGRPESHVLDQDYTTLAEILADRGAACVAWFQNRMLRRGLGIDQGFSIYQEMQGDEHGVGGQIVDRFLEWQAEHQGKGRYFAYLHLLDLHDPYTPKPPFDALFGEPAALAGVPRDGAPWRQWLKQVNRGELRPTRRQLRGLKNAYDGAIRKTDGQLERLFLALAERGVYDRTLIVVTADHGDGFMEHGFLSHGKAPYTELVHVPLIFKMPGLACRGVRVREQVRLVDVLPTVLAVYDGPDPGPRPASIDGRSLMPLIGTAVDGRPRPWPAPVAVSEILIGGQHLVVSVRDTSFTYLHRLDGADEMYDRDRDPGEQTNILGTGIAAEGRLRRRALEVARDAAEIDSSTIRVSAEELEQIRALGYAE